MSACGGTTGDQRVDCTVHLRIIHGPRGVTAKYPVDIHVGSRRVAAGGVWRVACPFGRQGNMPSWMSIAGRRGGVDVCRLAMVPSSSLPSSCSSTVNRIFCEA